MTITPTQDTTFFSPLFMPNFINGFQCAWASNTTLTLSSGFAKDSTGRAKLILSSPVTINAANSGAVNSLDTGTFAASTGYYTFVIGNSMNSTLYPTGGLLSTSATAPVLPKGYDSFRLVDFTPSDSSTHFLPFYQIGSGAMRYKQWDSLIAVVSAGTSATYAAVDLSTAVPSANFGRVTFQGNLTPNAAGDSASFRPTGSSATTVTSIVGDVATKVAAQQFTLLPLLSSSLPKIDYVLTSSSDALTLYVLGFEMLL